MTEIETLRVEAKELGIKFASNISPKTLRLKIDSFKRDVAGAEAPKELTPEDAGQELSDDPIMIPETPLEDALDCEMMSTTSNIETILDEVEEEMNRMHHAGKLKGFNPNAIAKTVLRKIRDRV